MSGSLGASSAAELDAIETKYVRRGRQVSVMWLNEPSAVMRE
ncbi:hypothetical protein [Streptomyces sp. NPDC093018]